MIKWIIWKDLISEIRTREMISSMFFFALIVIFIFSFSFSMDQKMAEAMMGGIIWVAFVFTCVIGLGRSFSVEMQNDCLEYLQMSPVPKSAVYLGKMASNFLFMLLVELILFPLFVIFFNLDVLENIPHLVLIFAVGTFGLSALGTLFSAMTVQVRAREVLFPVLLLPIVIPLIIGAVEATRGALNGDPFSLYEHWITLIVIFDLVFTIVAFWVFEFILDN